MNIAIRWTPLLLFVLLLTTAAPAANYYWVGGAGNWSDLSHWATTSGGATFHTRLPTARDDVFFDANSFTAAGQAVTIDVAEAVCGAMSWAGAANQPVLAGAADRVLRLFGGLTLITAMELRFDGQIRLQSDALSPFNRLVVSAGQTFPNDLYFDGPDGQWALADSLAVRGSLYVVRGSLNTSNRPVTCTNFIADGTGSRRISLTQSRVRLRRLAGEEPLIWRVRGENLILEARFATIEFLEAGAVYNQGIGQLEYHLLVFRGDGEFYRDAQADVRIDTMRLRRNATFFNGFTVNSLQLSRGFEYRFASERTFTIRALVAEGGCEGYVAMRSTTNGEAAFLRSAFDFNNTYLILQDLHNTGATVFRADNSIDLGNNEGWVINSPAPRTLYWVAGTGGWYESAHWSLSSGGTGGECPPTPLDDVFFDAASFTGPAQQVRGESGPQYYCHDMTWTGAAGTPLFQLPNLQLFGSLALQADMDLDLPVLSLRGRETGLTLTQDGQALRNVHLEGAGAWTLTDALRADLLLHYRGAFATGGQALDIEYYNTPLPNQVIGLDLGGSRVTVRGDGGPRPSWNLASDGGTVRAAQSTIDFTHPAARMLSALRGGPLSYGRVLFSDAAGSAQLRTGADASVATRYRAVAFAGDGLIGGANEFDTLRFAAGHAYQLEAGATQTLNDYWEMLGNPCAVINLSSTQAGARAVVRSTAATIDAASVDLRDQDAGGGADFNAGIGSRDLGNNTGWRFLNDGSGSARGLLGADRVLCAPLTIDPRLSDQGQTYLWSDASAGPTLTVDRAGDYSVVITYPGGCVIRDTVVLLDQALLRAPFGGDTTLCAGETLALDATFDTLALAATYRWQDGSAQPTFTVRQSGRYEVAVSASGCTETSAVQVTVVDVPPLDLGADRSACAGETVTLDAALAGAEAYRWSTGAATPTLAVTQPGSYGVEVAIGRCTRRDEVRVDFRPLPVVSLGADREACAGETVTLDGTAAGGADSYRWSDGPTTPQRPVTQSGTYVLEATRAGCRGADTVQVTFRPAPVLNLGQERQACAGEIVTLDGTAAGGADSYRWSDGPTTPQRPVTRPGLYILEATRAGCTARDSVQVTFIIFREDLLGADREACAGQPLLLDATVPYANATYAWNTGAATPRLPVTATGDYSVEVQVGQCRTSDAVRVVVNPVPSFDLGADASLCEGETYDLFIPATADSYRWSDGSNKDAISVGFPGGLVWGEATLGNCSFRDTVRVDFQPAPRVALGPDTAICAERPLTLRAAAGGAAVRWNTGAQTNTLRVDSPGTYWAEVSNGGCSARDSIVIDLKDCTFFSAYIPNAFSPNDDGVNDEFRPFLPPDLQIGSYRLTVFDRWGNQLFLSTDPARGWDGRRQGQLLPQGVYVYVLEVDFTDDDGPDSVVEGGDVVLVR